MPLRRPARPPAGSPIEAKHLAALAARIADDKKGVDVRVLDVSRQTNVADYLVLVTGLSRPQVKAVFQEIHLRTKALGERHAPIEGLELCWWVLVDFGDVVVHVMQPEAREFYDLEGLYGEAREIDWREVDVSVLEADRRVQA